jgi:hypothetical protein
MTLFHVGIDFVKDMKKMQKNNLQPKLANLSPLKIISMFIVLLTCQIKITQSSAIDDTLSFKSSVLGSLSSGQNASGRYQSDYFTHWRILTIMNHQGISKFLP